MEPPQRRTLIERIRALGVLPVVELGEVEQAAPLLEALAVAGLPAAEITLRTPAGLIALERLRATHPDALVGAGTVRTVAEARRVIDAGAQFVVSPATNPDVIGVCVAAGVPVLPGACTPTEIDLATRSGTRLVKFFPAEPMGGTRTLRALAGPFPEVSFVPTGGIGGFNLAEYLALPNVLACGGSWLAPPALLGEGRFDRIAELAREAAAIVAAARRR